MLKRYRYNLTEMEDESSFSTCPFHFPVADKFNHLAKHLAKFGLCVPHNRGPHLKMKT